MDQNSSPPRAPSPTPTAYSGISADRNDAYRTIDGGGKSKRNTDYAPAVLSSSPDPTRTAVARTQFHELHQYLTAYLANGMQSLESWCRSVRNSCSRALAPTSSRTNARTKLTRLTRQQFHELTTDVCDELIRRKENSEELMRRKDKTDEEEGVLCLMSISRGWCTDASLLTTWTL